MKTKTDLVIQEDFKDNLVCERDDKIWDYERLPMGF